MRKASAAVREGPERQGLDPFPALGWPPLARQVLQHGMFGMPESSPPQCEALVAPSPRAARGAIPECSDFDSAVQGHVPAAGGLAPHSRESPSHVRTPGRHFLRQEREALHFCQLQPPLPQGLQARRSNDVMLEVHPAARDPVRVLEVSLNQLPSSSPFFNADSVVFLTISDAISKTAF